MTDQQNSSGALMSDRVYDIVNGATRYGIPALGTLYFALAGIWGLPFAEQVLGTALAVETFLGVLIAISRNQYRANDANFDGVLHVDETRKEADIWTFDTRTPLEELRDKQEVTFKVDRRV